MPWLGAILTVHFLFWTFLAHMLFALILGLNGMEVVAEDWRVLLSREGLVLLAVQGVTGGLVALLLYALMAVSLPLALDREVDFVTAMLTSLAVVRRNTRVMAVWALLIATTTLAAMLPLFLGLLMVLPVLGHASWHLCRRALGG